MPTFDISFPRALQGEVFEQGEEVCEVVLPDGRRRFRFHDYHEIYSVPGLYEQLFYDELECRSPTVVRELLEQQMREWGGDPRELRVLDVGAGNGMVGEELARLGAGLLVGIDIIPEAAAAAERDRPGVYDEYHVLDLTAIPPETHTLLHEQRFNCLVTVAALGFGDIPPEAFAAAFDLLGEGAWVAFCIKEDFLDGEDRSGFSALVARMLDEGILALEAQRRYRHRLSATREPLPYIALVARKDAELPADWVRQGLL